MSDKDPSDACTTPPAPRLARGCGHRAAAHIRREAVADSSEPHEGPEQDRVPPTNPNMSRLPVLLLLHLLVSPGLQAPMTQTTSLKTSWAKCSNMIDEIITHLNQPPLPSPVSSWDKTGLQQGGVVAASGQQASWASLSLHPIGLQQPQ